MKELSLVNPLRQIELVTEEVRRRASQRVNVLDVSFAKQFKFIKDPAKLKAGFCTRRAGKSYGIGLALVQACLDNAGTSSLYVALTRESAKRIMFKDVLHVINRKHDLGMEFNNSDLTVRFANGSLLYLMGMDSSEDEAHKALGQKFKLAVVDEAASFRRDLRDIVYKVLRPAATDLNGQIILIGTPSNITKGLFFDVVHGKEPGWALHQWSAFDNPYIADKWRAEIEELKSTNPLVIETPWFKQMYLGQYVVDVDSLVYKFNYERNAVAEIPSDLTYVLGVDLGFDDPSAFVVVGYKDLDRKLYILDIYKQSKMIISDVAERIKYYEKTYQPVRMVIDNAAKQSVEELKQRFQIPLIAADKHGKAEFIEIMNSEFIMGNILAKSDSCEQLFSEYETLIWDDKSAKRQEHPNCDNHLADAALYAWRNCYNYLNSPIQINKMTDEDKIDIWFERESEKIDRRRSRNWIDNEYAELVGEE